MWTTRFFTEFRDDDQGLWRVDIQAPDYSGAPVRLTPAGNPLEWMSSGSESQTENIIGGTGTLRLIVETPEQIAAFTSGGVLPNSALSRRVIVTRSAEVPDPNTPGFKMTVTTTVWVGYVQMQTFSQDWEAAPVEIELPLMDTVEALNHIYIDTDETATTTMQLLLSAYAKALQGDGYQREKKAGQTPTGYEVGGVSLTDFMRTNIKEYRDRYNEKNGKDWTEAAVFTEHYCEPEKDGKPGDRATFSEAIAQILSPFGRLSQTGPRWLFSIANVFRSEIYKPDQSKENKLIQVDMSEWHDTADISNAVAGADNNQGVLPAPSKVTANYDPEEGAIDFSGDTIIQLDADNIKSHNSDGAKNVTWHDDSGDHTLRYMKIADGKSDNAFLWPVIVASKDHMVADYYQYRLNPGTQYRSKTITSSLLSGNPGPWCQVVQNTDGWKVVEGHTLCFRRTFNITENVNEQGHDYLLKQDIVTLRVLRELITSRVSVLKFTAKMQVGNLTKEADFSGADHTQEIYHPFVQIYWGPTPNGKPKRVLNRHDGSWIDCSSRGFFFPDNADDASMIPYDRMTHGQQFHLPNNLPDNLPDNRGYVSFRLYASGWTTPGAGAPTISYAEEYYANRDYEDKEWFTLSSMKLEYAAWTGDTPVTLLDWNKEYTDDKEYQYNNGSEEVSLHFKTLAGAAPSASTLLAPRWGFCDYAMNVVRTPREMVDIDAVQVTTDSDIPGVTRFSLFSFKVEDETTPRTYYPAAVGMNAKDNTVRLKLIRTL